MSELIENLTDLLTSPAYSELEEMFKEEARKIKYRPVDRNKTYEQQGMENHVNEQVHVAVIKILQIIRDRVQAKAKPKSWK